MGVNRRVGGRDRRFTFARYPDTSLADARIEAAELLNAVRKGADPVEEARKLRRERDRPAPATVQEAVLRARGTSRTTLWRDVKAGRFPAPIRLGPRSIGWFEHEVRQWLLSRPRCG